MSLIDFTRKYLLRTDKYNLGYIKEFYNELLEPRRFNIKEVLEIGVDRGYSILLWRDYFPNANITGIDIIPCPSLSIESRIKLIYNNAYTDEFVQGLPNNFYDLVIDDGPHTFESMKFFLTKYLDKVKPGGLLILEDIINPNWTPILLKLIDPTTNKIIVKDMRGKQLTNDLLYRWSKGLEVIIVHKL